MFESIVRNIARKYNHEKYWKIRNKMFDNKYPFFILPLMKFYLKRTEANNNAYIGLNLENPNNISKPLNLPHGLSGIFIARNAVIGENVTIHQQVTIGVSLGKAPNIGNDVFIGAGAKIIGNVKVGNHVRIGANAVVIKDVPDNTTVVLSEMRMISKPIDYVYYSERD